LFEDNAEFGFGMRVALDQRIEAATAMLRDMRELIGTELADSILFAEQLDETGINEQRKRVVALKTRIETILAEDADQPKLVKLAEYG
jgi:pyruvate-ferredoxin/flavodoxin oxidoreductase